MCSAALDKGKCDYNSWQYGYTEKHIIYSLREMDYESVFSKENDDFSSEIVLLENKSKQLEKSLEAKAELLFRDDVTPIFMDKIVAESAKLEEALNQTREELQRLQHATILAKEDISLEKLGELFDNSSEDDLDKRLELNQLLKGSIATIKFIPIKKPDEDSVHSRIEIYFRKSTKKRSIIIYDERVKYSRLQNKSTSFTIDGDDPNFDIDNPNVDTDIIIHGDTVERQKAITDGMNFIWEVEE